MTLEILKRRLWRAVRYWSNRSLPLPQQSSRPIGLLTTSLLVRIPSGRRERPSQFITQLYKRARPVVDQRKSVGGETARDSLLSRPIFLFGENELFNHLSLLETLATQRNPSKPEVTRRHFQAGEELLTQGKATESIHFVFSGIIQVTRQVQDGRVLNVRKVGPGHSFGGISLLTGMPSSETLTAAPWDCLWNYTQRI